MHKCSASDPAACINPDGSLCDRWETSIGTTKSPPRFRVGAKRPYVKKTLLRSDPHGRDWLKDHWDGSLDYLNKDRLGPNYSEWDDPTADAALADL